MNTKLVTALVFFVINLIFIVEYLGDEPDGTGVDSRMIVLGVYLMSLLLLVDWF